LKKINRAINIEGRVNLKIHSSTRRKRTHNESWFKYRLNVAQYTFYDITYTYVSWLTICLFYYV